MSKKVKVAVLGVGKMGLSHLSILGAHPDVEVIAICDTSSLVLSAFKKFNPSFQRYDDFSKLYEIERPDAVIIASPTKLHFAMAKPAIMRGIHVFCEKPFSLTYQQGKELVELAEKHSVVNQVGYHNHFIATFMEMKRLLQKGILGKLLHFTGEAYGPVITKPKGGSWRAVPEEGGGCLNDYASHVINLIQEVISRPTQVRGTLLKKFYSVGVEDGVYSTLSLANGLTGNLSVNWSDETYRKMSTSLMVFGENGKIICDATEIKIYMKSEMESEKLAKGWTIKYITDLVQPVQFYLRGEEYSHQIDYFIKNIIQGQPTVTNSFEQALYTDKVIEMLKTDAAK